MVGIDGAHGIGAASAVAANTRDGAARFRFGRELAVVTTAAAVYFGVREYVEGSTATALGNAGRIRGFESRLGFDIEQHAQELVVVHGPFRMLGNFSYVWLHWPLLIAVLAMLYRCDPGRYRRLRDALIWSGALGLVIFALFPVSPPRFLPDYIGTVTDAERRHHLPFPIEWSNRYASFPSFHVGWTLIACLALAGLLRPGWMRTLVMLPAVLVALSVVTTGNHYLVDAVAGATISLASYMLLGARDHNPSPRGAVVQATNPTRPPAPAGLHLRACTTPSGLQHAQQQSSPDHRLTQG